MGVLARAELDERVDGPGLWHVRAHVAVRDLQHDEAAEFAAEAAASISRDDGNWTIAVLSATAIGPVGGEDADAESEHIGEEEVVITFEADRDSAAAAVSSVEYWLDGLYSEQLRVLYVEQNPDRATEPAGAAARVLGNVCQRLEATLSPWGDTITVDDAEVFLTLLDRRLNGRAVVQVYSVDVDETHRAAGIGTRTVHALLNAAAEQDADVIVGPITNPDFWGRFEDLQELDSGYFVVGGGYMSNIQTDLSAEQLESIQQW